MKLFPSTFMHSSDHLAFARTEFHVLQEFISTLWTYPKTSKFFYWTTMIFPIVLFGKALEGSGCSSFTPETMVWRLRGYPIVSCNLLSPPELNCPISFFILCDIGQNNYRATEYWRLSVSAGVHV